MGSLKRATSRFVTTITAFVSLNSNQMRICPSLIHSPQIRTSTTALTSIIDDAEGYRERSESQVLRATLFQSARKRRRREPSNDRSQFMIWSDWISKKSDFNLAGGSSRTATIPKKTFATVTLSGFPQALA